MGAILIALAMIVVGIAALRYLSFRSVRFETAFVVLGVALTACGIAVFRDGVDGSRRILWVLGPAASSDRVVAAEEPVNGRLP